MPDDCIFCNIANRVAPAEVIDADTHSIAFMDISPATRGHALVIPRRHVRNLYEIDERDLHRTISMARAIARRMPAAIGADGVNILNSCESAAWQTVFHFHLHVIPRYDDDPLSLPWTPGALSTDDIASVAERLR